MIRDAISDATMAAGAPVPRIPLMDAGLGDPTIAENVDALLESSAGDSRRHERHSGRHVLPIRIGTRSGRKLSSARRRRESFRRSSSRKPTSSFRSSAASTRRRSSCRDRPASLRIGDVRRRRRRAGPPPHHKIPLAPYRPGRCLNRRPRCAIRRVRCPHTRRTPLPRNSPGTKKELSILPADALTLVCTSSICTGEPRSIERTSRER